MKKKKIFSSFIAIIVTILICVLGFFLGRKISDNYEQKYGEKKTILQMFKIEQKDIEIKYILENGPEKIKELCKKDTGICDEEVGTIKFNNKEVKLYLHVNFDNLDSKKTIYFMLNDIKIGSFNYLDEFALFDNKYLIVTEPNSDNDNYIIHIYDNRGKEMSNFTGTNISSYEIKGDNLYFYYCDPSDTETNENTVLPRVSKFKVNSSSITKKIEESFEYKVCN